MFKKIDVNRHSHFYKVGKKKFDFYTSDWILEVVETDEEFEAWLSLDMSGTKNFIYGEPKWQSYRKEWVSLDEFLENVKVGLKTDKEIYMVEHYAIEEAHARRLGLEE